MTLAYHPQSNGAVERINREILNMLKKYALHRANDWDRNLELLLFAYRAAPHASTGFAPFEMNRGIPARLPSSSWFLNPPPLIFHSDSLAPDPQAYIEDLKHSLALIHTLAREELMKAKNYQSHQFNKRTRINPFSVGDLVMCHEYLEGNVGIIN